VVADITRGDLSWAAEARLSLKDIQAVEMDSFVTHIVRVGESLEKQAEVTATKMEDFGHFFKLGHTILTDKSVPCARPALIEAFRNTEEQDGNVKVFYDVYTTTVNRSKEGLGAKEVREAIAAIQDDGKILKKILEVVAIPLSPELKEQVNSGDMFTFEGDADGKLQQTAPYVSYHDHTSFDALGEEIPNTDYCTRLD
jgi:hypothetical protein